MYELKPENVNDAWKNLWSEIMNDFKGFLGIDEVRKIIYAARQVSGRCANVLHKDVQDHVEGPWEVSTNEELKELVESSIEEEEEKLKQNQRCGHYWYLPMFWIVQILKVNLTEYDPHIKHSIKVTCMITRGLQPLQQHFDELEKPTSEYNVIPKDIGKKNPSTIKDPWPSTSSASDIQPLSCHGSMIQDHLM